MVVYCDAKLSRLQRPYHSLGGNRPGQYVKRFVSSSRAEDLRCAVPRSMEGFSGVFDVQCVLWRSSQISLDAQ
jgi:hypothetical protein